MTASWPMTDSGRMPSRSGANVAAQWALNCVAWKDDESGTPLLAAPPFESDWRPRHSRYVVGFSRPERAGPKAMTTIEFQGKSVFRCRGCQFQ